MTSAAAPLQRFLDAQSGIYQTVLAELAAGQKRTHWMWFIFPQFAGLGTSPTSIFYAIGSLNEARAFVDHDILGARLTQCAALALAVNGRSARQIFGAIDARKFQSSMTLFSEVRPEIGVFAACLEKYYAGERDPATCEKIGP